MANHKRLKVWLFSLALICYIVSLFLPVWSIRLQNNGPYTYFDMIWSPGPYTYSDISAIGGYSDAHIRYFTFFPSGDFLITDLPPYVQLALSVLIVMTIITIFVVAAQLVSLYRKKEAYSNHKLGNLTIVSALLTIFTPLVFAFLWPSAMIREVPGVDYSFWGHITEYSGNPEYSGSLTYGPNVGWYLQVLAFILIVSAIIIVFASRETGQPKAEESPPTVQYQGLVAILIVLAVVFILLLCLR
jgi:hypothetical protein